MSYRLGWVARAPGNNTPAHTQSRCARSTHFSVHVGEPHRLAALFWWRCMHVTAQHTWCAMTSTHKHAEVSSHLMAYHNRKRDRQLMDVRRRRRANVVVSHCCRRARRQPLRDVYYCRRCCVCPAVTCTRVRLKLYTCIRIHACCGRLHLCRGDATAQLRLEYCRRRKRDIVGVNACRTHIADSRPHCRLAPTSPARARVADSAPTPSTRAHAAHVCALAPAVGSPEISSDPEIANL